MLRGGGGNGNAIVAWGARALAAQGERARAVRWGCAHGAVLALLAAELASPCGPQGALRWAEAALASLAALALLTHALRAARAKAKAPPDAPLSPAQLRLLGLRADRLDSSFVSLSPVGRARSPSPPSPELSLSLRAPLRPPSPPSPPPSPPSPTAADLTAASDDMDLTRYYMCSGGRSPPSSPPYQLSSVEEEGGARGAGAAGDGALWRRVRIEPTRLTEFTLNLRVWLQLTVVRRVARELDACGAEAGGRLPHHLLPYLEPFADRQYCARRVRALAAGGALSAYRWARGGPDWAAGQPCDAALLLQLLAAYLDGVLPGGAAQRPFSSRHVSRGALPGRPPCLHVSAPPASPSPPHVSLSLGDAWLAPPPGPHNLFHALLLFVAALARRRPPCLGQVHLGPAGLNMLWIIGK